MICGSEALPTQTAHIIKSFDSESRAVIINNLGAIIKIPADEMTAMKTSLSLPWNLLREIRRWLRTFKVNVASEHSMRDVSTEWVGTGLHSSIVLKPWTYIYNLVGYVLKYLEDLDKNGLIYDGHIPQSEIGGDHGGGSFKMSFQVANVSNPNKPQNSVVFR